MTQRYINHFTEQFEIIKIWDRDDKKPTDDESEDGKAIFNKSNFNWFRNKDRDDTKPTDDESENEKPIFNKSNSNWIKIHQSFHKTIWNYQNMRWR